MNWRFKSTSTNNHVNNYELDELPIANCGKNVEALKTKIVQEVALQCEMYLEERQIILDALVALVYGLPLGDILYIASKDGMTKENQHILERAYNSGESDL